MYRNLIVAGYALLATTLPISAQERIALVMGNAAYQTAAPVPAAQENAQIVADGLTALGFDVNLVINANLRFQRFSIQQYLDALQQAEPGSIGIVYYQGHGVAVSGTNYLLPPNIASGDAGAIARTSIDVSSLLTSPAGGSGTQSVVILDCCQANPFSSESDTTGQAFVPLDAPDGVLLAYAAAIGEAVGPQSTFARDLMEQISAPGTSMQDALAALAPNFVSSGVDAPITLTEPAELTAEDQAWNAIRDTTDPDAVLAFLETYPDGAYSDRAQNLIVDLLEQQLEAAAAAQAEEAEPTPETETPEAEPEEPASEPEQAVASEPEEDADSALAVEAAPAATDSAEPVDIEAEIALSEVSFSVPLAAGSPEVVGMSIEELIAGMPLFAPIEGLPEELWKDQECASCHEWNPANLCDQANFYLGEAGAANPTKPHPYGGTFKQNLAQWARGGCQ